MATDIQEIGPNIKPTEIKIPHYAYVIMFSFLSAQVTASVYVEDYLFAGIAGTILGYQRSSGHPNNLHIDLQGGLSPMAGLGNPALKKVLFVVNCSGHSEPE